MNQIKYALINIRESKIINLIFAIQMIMILLLFTDSCSNIISFINGVKRFTYMRENSAYINSDSTSDGQIGILWKDEKESLDKAKELYSYIKNNTAYESYTVWSYTTKEKYNNKSIQQYCADRKLFDMLYIKCLLGNLYSNDENIDSVIPIVIGYKLKDTYKLNEDYEIFNYSSNTATNVKVIGVLELNSTIPSLYNIGSSLNLDYSMFIPISENMLNNFANLDMAINSTVIFTDDETNLLNISMKSAELNLFSMQYKSMQSNIDNYSGYLKDKLQSRIITIVILSIFSIGSMILNLLTLISKKKKEFVIHLMTGATRKDLMIQLIWHVGILFVPAIIICLVIGGLNNSFLYTMIFSVILIFVLLLLPLTRIKKIDIATMLRREGI